MKRLYGTIVLSTGLTLCVFFDDWVSFILTVITSILTECYNTTNIPDLCKKLIKYNS